MPSDCPQATQEPGPTLKPWQRGRGSGITSPFRKAQDAALWTLCAHVPGEGLRLGGPRVVGKRQACSEHTKRAPKEGCQFWGL